MDLIPTDAKLRKLLVVFVIVKAFGFIIKILFAGSASTQLEMAEATQNQGMSYIFNIVNISNFIYYLILYVSYSSGKWKKVSVVLTIFILLELILNASRMGIINMLFINSFLYDRFVKRINIFYLILLAPIIIFVIAFFGLVRDLEIGSIEVYSKTFFELVGNFDIVVEIFMHRLDLLDLMIPAGRDYFNGALPDLNGKSYIYTFLHAVPRNVWPDKPLLSAALITSIERPGHFAQGVNFYCTIIIEGLMNFGVYGVIFSGCVTGYLSRILDNFKESNNGYKVLIYISAFTFPMGLFNEGIHSNFSVQFLYQLFLIGFTVFLINFRIGKR